MNYYVAREMNGILVFRGLFSNPNNANSVGKVMGNPYKIITELERNNALSLGLSYADLHSYDEQTLSTMQYTEGWEAPPMFLETVAEPMVINPSLPDITQMTVWQVKFLDIETIMDGKQLVSMERDGKNRKRVISILEERIQKLEQK